MLEALNRLAFHVTSERQEEAGDVGGFVFGGVRNASYGGSLVVVAQGLKPPRVAGGGSKIFAEDRAGSGTHNEAHSGFESMEGLRQRGSAGGLSSIRAPKVEAATTCDKKSSQLNPGNAGLGSIDVLNANMRKETPNLLVQSCVSSNSGPPHRRRGEREVDTLPKGAPMEFTGNQVPANEFFAQGGVMGSVKLEGSQPCGLYVSLYDHLMDVLHEIGIPSAPSTVQLPQPPEARRVGIVLPIVSNFVNTIVVEFVV